MGGGEQGTTPLLAKKLDGPEGHTSVLRTGLIIGLYLVLNSSLNLLNRYTLGHAGFRYPVSLTCFHLTFQLCSLAPLLMRAPYAGTHGESVGRNWKGVALIGTFMSLNIGLNNASLLHLSLSFNQVIRATIPVVCAICAVFVENKVPTPSEVRMIRLDWGQHLRAYVYPLRVTPFPPLLLLSVCDLISYRLNQERICCFASSCPLLKNCHSPSLAAPAVQRERCKSYV
jgi:hypothetical protein